MNMNTTQNNDDFRISIADLEAFNKQLHELKDNLTDSVECIFLTIADVMEITGWSKKTVEDLFNNPAFPCTDLGKKKLVLKAAFIRFFNERRCKDDQNFWKY